MYLWEERGPFRIGGPLEHQAILRRMSIWTLRVGCNLPVPSATRSNVPWSLKNDLVALQCHQRQRRKVEEREAAT